MKVDMIKEQVREWLLGEHEARGLDLDSIDHIIDCLYGIVRWYNDGVPTGDFLNAILRNDFMEACGIADNTNAKVLPVYAKFLYNCLPLDYLQRVKNEK